MKPLGHKAYGSIPHLPESRLGPSDSHCSPGQAIIATQKKRDKHDLIIVQEKLDGSNVAAAKLNGKIIALSRAGYLIETSPYQQHHFFGYWVKENEARLSELLNEGERVCGEWLAMAAGTRYELPHEPFVAFDLMTGKNRLNYFEFSFRASMAGLVLPRLLRIGEPLSIPEAMEMCVESGHGAIDPVEGAIWRVERRGEVDFLCKFVKHDKQDGKYFAEKNNGITTWNCDVSKWLNLKQ